MSVHSPRTVVHLVRHGEVHNPDKILYGRLPDFHLSSRGVDQARTTAHSFANHDITALYCSPLERTRETAAPISDIVGLEPQVCDKLIEAGNSFEGMRIKGLRSQLWNPKYWPRLRKPSIPSWGEPYEEIADRIFEVIEEARAAAEGHEAILVTHQLCVVSAARRARELPLAHNPANRQCELASVTSLIFQGEDIIGVHYAEPAANI